MVTTDVSQLYINTKSLLKQAEIEEYRFEAKVLIEHFFGITRTELVTKGDLKMQPEKVKMLNEAINKRVHGYPLQYIIGEWEFYGYQFKVGEGVLIPRADTETIIDTVKGMNFKKPVIIDLCSGSGCIAITLKKQINDSEVYAVEKYSEAYFYLQENIELNGVDVTAVKGDVLSNSFDGVFPIADVITCNPPYLDNKDMDELQKEVLFEPKTALYGEDDGLYFYREITTAWKDRIKDGGVLCYEIGIGQAEKVKEILEENGFTDINKYSDLNSIIRVVTGKK